MLMNLHESKWTSGLTLRSFGAEATSNESILADMEKQSAAYAKMVAEEDKKTPEEIALQSVGKVDPKKRLESDVVAALTANIGQCLGAMLDKTVF